jgi:hypothetical protein
LLAQFALRETNNLSWSQAYQADIWAEGWLAMTASLVSEILDQRGVLLEPEHSSWSAQEQSLRLSLIDGLMAVMPPNLRQSVAAALMPADQNSSAVTAPAPPAFALRGGRLVPILPGPNSTNGRLGNVGR